MTPGSPPLDLLVVGGLTIDRFDDGSSAAGGSVVHIARAAESHAIRIGVVTVAGPEPQAQAALQELRRLTATLDWTDADRTLTFTHHEEATGRHLRLESTGGRVQLDPEAVARARTVLVAPLADEVGVDQLARLGRERPLAAILQGFLRSVADDGAVRPLHLSALAPGLVDALSGFDLLVASREDLAAEGPNPRDQLAALRRVFGSRPELLITDGLEGVWTEREHLAVPRTISGVSTVGAGDILAAFITAWSAPPAPSLSSRAEDAMQIVAEVLEARRQP